MRSPSAKVTINSVSIFHAVTGRDDVGGPTWTYPGTPDIACVACTVQPSAREVEDEQLRVTMVVVYYVMFSLYVDVRARDQILWTDNGGKLRTLFVTSTFDEAGRGAAFTITAVERT